MDSDANAKSKLKMPWGLVGETALITGGGTGLGYAIAECMAASGARVVLVGRRAEVLERAAAAIGDAATYEVFDITNVASMPELVSRVESEAGTPTVLVNNAGIHLKKAALDTTEDEFQRVWTTHVLGAYALSRAVAPAMIARNAGVILFISSMAVYMGVPYVTAYSAAKSAYVGMVKTLAEEWSPHGVRVNAIAPGWIESPMLRKAMADDPEREQKVLSRVMMRRFGEPADVGWAAVYLASNAARYVTGIHLPVDGGASAGF